MSGNTAISARCADVRSVWGICVVRGAPKRIWAVKRTGMEIRERREAIMPV